VICLRESYWVILRAELERSATGATIHDVLHGYYWTRDRIQLWCKWKNNPDDRYYDGSLVYTEEQATRAFNGAVQQLKQYGYDNVNLFIEEVS